MVLRTQPTMLLNTCHDRWIADAGCCQVKILTALLWTVFCAVLGEWHIS